MTGGRDTASLRPVVVTGGGDHSGVIIDALLTCGVSIRGLCDPSLSVGSCGPHGVPVLGGDRALEDMDPAEIRLVNGIGSVSAPKLRASVFSRLKGLGFEFASVLHPSATLARDVVLGEGSQIMAGSVVQSAAIIGDNVLINTSASIDHHCRIGTSAHIAPGAVLSGSVTVGEGTHVGPGARVIQNIVIGENVIVGAGVTVLAGIPAGTTVHPMKTPVWAGPPKS